MTRALVVVLIPLVLAAAGDAQQPAPASSSLDPVAALVRELDESDAPTAALRGALETLGGRAALAEELETTATTITTERRSAALRALLDPGAEHAESFRSWLLGACREWKHDIGLLEGGVRKLRADLQETYVLSSDLRKFLEEPEAALQLYRELVRERARPDRMTAATRPFLEPDDTGRLGVPAVLREAADRALARDREVSRAMDMLKGGSAGKSQDDVDLALMLHAGGADRDDPVAVARRVLDRAVKSLPADTPLETRANAEDALRTARWHASRLGDDPALEGWRSLLTTPRALLLPLPAPPKPAADPVKTLLDDTPFGRALLIEKGKARINPHATWDMERLLQQLARRARVLEPLRREAMELARASQPGELRDALLSPPGPDVLVEAAIREAGATEPDRLATWVERTFERRGGKRVVRGEARETMKRLIDRAAVAGREVAAPGARTTLALSSLAYAKDGFELLRSSAFYNPRTLEGARAYFAQFPDHHTVRTFGTFEWSVRKSTDVASFVKNLEERREGLKLLAATHDKVIVHINCVPAWLSSAPGGGTFEGGVWKNAETRPPKSIELWTRLVREFARVVKDSVDVERYYEFWNEPDLAYWQGTSEEFLELYEQTARTLREVDPEGKIGCCAVNQWDGRVKGDRGSPPLNQQFIRFAASRRLPLDFVSWHHFGRPVDAIAEAKAAYAAELLRSGVTRSPELLVTEWAVAGRGSPWANPRFAETMLALFEARVTAQTVSMWEESHAKPVPDEPAPWGLITQQGERKGTWYVHRFFDRASRGSQGLATVARAGDVGRLVVSRKADGVYDVLAWQAGIAPRLQAALDVLREAGFPTDGWEEYGTAERFERAVAEAAPRDHRWDSAFTTARRVYDEHPVQTERLVLELEGARSVEVLWAESIRTEHASPAAAVLRNTVTVPLRRDEVVRLLLRVE